MIAVIQASLGGIDTPTKGVEQSLRHDYFLFDDYTLPPRKSLTARLQAKIPKCFSYELKPDYQYYLWLDGNISLAQPDTLQYFYDQIQGYDIVTIRHHRRPNIRQEVRYLRKGLREQSIYLISRYEGEMWKEQYEMIQADKEFVDDLLVIGGIFMYRNTPQVQEMLKEWWYNITRYNVQDQISFPYVLKKSGIKIKVLDHDYNTWNYIKVNGHAKRNV